ncbi:hypothetical protein NDU88_002690 [Pleurodeles waltl]|uniref:Uncharacterized protein n=1 Tax=Pleurodeles waltl TaxID=8319 RepID=A0AAV7W2K4_PLEWA|nr:hypothetical protein NDU88_002690 [Pleurodeles waltl]
MSRSKKQKTAMQKIILSQNPGTGQPTNEPIESLLFSQEGIFSSIEKLFIESLQSILERLDQMEKQLNQMEQSLTDPKEDLRIDSIMSTGRASMGVNDMNQEAQVDAWLLSPQAPIFKADPCSNIIPINSIMKILAIAVPHSAKY